MNRLRTLVVDDEPLNRQELSSLLMSYKEIEQIGEAENSKDALEIILHQRIDLVFLDIEMEEKRSGLKLAKKIARLTSPPFVVFVTAHDKYVLESYDYEPLHYLLKPINEDRFHEALQRAFRLKITTSRLIIKYRKEEVAGMVSYPVAYIQANDILYIQKNKLGNTVIIYLQGEEELAGVRQTLEQLLKQLNQAQFSRVHTSFIANLAQVKELKQRMPNDENYCLIMNETTAPIPVSRSHLNKVRGLLERI